MKVLIVSQYFWPETFIINDVVRILDEQGHQVYVATGKPNYPDGNLFEGYRAWGIQNERYSSNVEVLRVPLWPRGKGGARNLILNYLSFVFSGLLFFPWMLRGREFDAILVFAPSPILQAIPAIALKWLKRVRLALWVQDLWPESLAATGFVRNRQAIWLVGWVVRGIYKFCDKLLVQSQAFVEPVARYADRHKITYYPNSLDVMQATPVGIPDDLKSLLERHFCVVFAGNLGAAQALDTLVQAAILLRESPDIRVVLVGSGSRLDWLVEQKRQHGLENLVLPGRFPMAAMPEIFERASALLVSLNDEEIFAQTVPSKIQAYLAAGRPILASINGEGARIVSEAAAGLCSPAGEAAPLAENILRLQAMNLAERLAMGRRGKAYFDAHFEMTAQVARLVELLQR